MSEEECIKELIHWSVVLSACDIGSNKRVAQAIDRILDLYNREKAKNIRYEKYLKNKDKTHEEVLEYMETEKENDYIRKDKIKAKIEEMENIIKSNYGHRHTVLEASIVKGELENLLKE